MAPSYIHCFHCEDASCHKAQVISNWHNEHDSEFSERQRPPQSLDLNPVEHFWENAFY